MLSYLDNSATTRPTDGVIEKMAETMREGFYNPSSLYAPALDAEKALNACRAEIARAIRVSGDEITFTSGGTESNHLAVEGALRAGRGQRHLIVSSVEHPSVLAACEMWREAGCRVTLLRTLPDGQPDFDMLEDALSDNPSLISCMQVNNETGAMPDLARLIALTRKRAPGCLIHVDGVQGFLREPFDARQVDLYTMSSHKIHGPKGVGALYVRKGVRLAPIQTGGGQERGLRAGTENTPGISGFLEAIREMNELPVSELLEKKQKRLYEAFRAAVPEMLVNGPEFGTGAKHILNLSFPGVRGEVLLHALEGEGVYCSTGSACSSKKRKVSQVLTAMGMPIDRAECALRFSLSPRTEDSEIDYAAEKLAQIYPALKRFRRR